MLSHCLFPFCILSLESQGLLWRDRPLVPVKHHSATFHNWLSVSPTYVYIARSGKLLMLTSTFPGLRLFSFTGGRDRTWPLEGIVIKILN